LTITDSFRLAQRTGREYLNAEEDYLLASISLLIERHLWGPRFFNDTAVDARALEGDGGNFEHTLGIWSTRSATTKRLPYRRRGRGAHGCGGRRSSSAAPVSGQYEQSSEIVLGGNIPLLRGAGACVAREKHLIQAERDMIYAARSVRGLPTELPGQTSPTTTSPSCRHGHRSSIRSARTSRSDASTEVDPGASVDAGRESRFRVAIVENQLLLDGIASLASLREQYILAARSVQGSPGPGSRRTRSRSRPLEFELAEPDIDEYDAARSCARVPAGPPEPAGPSDRRPASRLQRQEQPRSPDLDIAGERSGSRRIRTRP
jgi:hypothetical protein